MCMEDIRIGRKIRTAVTVVAAPIAVDTPLCAFSAKRVFVAFGISANGALIAPAVADVPVATGINFPLNMPYHEFTIDRHGDVVTFPWKATGNGGTSTVVVIEGFLADE